MVTECARKDSISKLGVHCGALWQASEGLCKGWVGEWLWGVKCWGCAWQFCWGTLGARWPNGCLADIPFVRWW